LFGNPFLIHSNEAKLPTPTSIARKKKCFKTKKIGLKKMKLERWCWKMKLKK